MNSFPPFDINILDCKNKLNYLVLILFIKVHFTKIDENDFGNSKQYKISATAKIEDTGVLFEEIKKFEEDRLPEGLVVSAIIIASFYDISVTIG